MIPKLDKGNQVFFNFKKYKKKISGRAKDKDTIKNIIGDKTKFTDHVEMIKIKIRYTFLALHLLKFTVILKCIKLLIFFPLLILFLLTLILTITNYNPGHNILELYNILVQI